VALVQQIGDGQADTVRVAEHIVVPEADDAIALTAKPAGALRFLRGVMLAAVDFDDELEAVAAEVGGVVAKRNLEAEMLFREVFAE
jgi:hypothetical protein